MRSRGASSAPEFLPITKRLSGAVESVTSTKRLFSTRPRQQKGKRSAERRIGKDEKVRFYIDEPYFISSDPLDISAAEKQSRKFSDADREAFNAVKKRIMAEYTVLSETRNALLHGTWFVGYASLADPNASTFHVQKYQTTKSGLTPVEGLPKSAPELLALAQRCDDTRNWIAYLDSCLNGLEPFNKRFRQERGDWLLMSGGGESTLPRKPPEPTSPNPVSTDTR